MRTSCVLMGACLLLLNTAPLQAQYIRENTYNWFAQDHSCWKALANFPTGYVMGGSRFFEPNNTAIVITGFNSLSQHNWTKTHTAPEFSSLDTFWKSSTQIGPLGSPTGFFFATAGTRNGSSSYYTLQTDKSGNLVKESFGPNSQFQFGGACQAVDGGFIVAGGDNNGKVIVVKFNAAGELETSNTTEFSGFAWSVEPAPDGGYVMGSTSSRATRVDNDLNFVWSTVVGLPPSPAPDGSNYTYTEFEEILPLKNSGSGFIISGSAFSNSTSGVYTANVSWDGVVSWSKINDSANTSLAGTPVAWSNSPVEMVNPNSGEWEVFYSWRKGPVSTGGDLRGERINANTGDTVEFGGLGNTIPVQEAFTIRQPFTNQVVIGGTRGSYPDAYSFSKANDSNTLMPLPRPEPGLAAGEGGTPAATNVNVTNARRAK